MTRPHILLALTLAIAGCGSERPSPDSAPAMPASAEAGESNGPRVSGGMGFAMASRSYREGDHVDALRRFLDLAEDGDANAQFYAGVMYADGQGTQQNLAAATKWFQKAAEQNQPDALRAMARMHVFGLGGVKRDIPSAINFYERAEKAYPPGEERDQIAQQRKALVALEDERKGTSSAGVEMTVVE